MADCTQQYQAYQTALANEAVKTAYWAVKAAEAYLAQLDMYAAQQLTMQAYQAYQACMMGGMRLAPDADPLLTVFVNLRQAGQAHLDSLSKVVASATN